MSHTHGKSFLWLTNALTFYFVQRHPCIYERHLPRLELMSAYVEVQFIIWSKDTGNHLSIQKQPQPNIKFTFSPVMWMKAVKWLGFGWSSYKWWASILYQSSTSFFCKPDLRAPIWDHVWNKYWMHQRWRQTWLEKWGTPDKLKLCNEFNKEFTCIIIQATFSFRTNRW